MPNFKTLSTMPNDLPGLGNKVQAAPTHIPDKVRLNVHGNPHLISINGKMSYLPPTPPAPDTKKVKAKPMLEKAKKTQADSFSRDMLVDQLVQEVMRGLKLTRQEVMRGLKLTRQEVEAKLRPWLEDTSWDIHVPGHSRPAASQNTPTLKVRRVVIWPEPGEIVYKEGHPSEIGTQAFGKFPQICRTIFYKVLP